MATLILGIPYASHQEALLRETAGGGRVPHRYHHTHSGGIHCWDGRCGREWVTSDVYGSLVLHDPADPEAGAMGLARLAWVAAKMLGLATEQTPLWLLNDGGAAGVLRVELHGHALLGLAGVRARGNYDARWSSEPDDLGLPEVSALAELQPVLRMSGVSSELLARCAGLVGIHLGILSRVERVEAP